MGITPPPGKFYNLQCRSNDGLEATFTDEHVSISIAATPELLADYKVDSFYDFVVREHVPEHGHGGNQDGNSQG